MQKNTDNQKRGALYIAATFAAAVLIGSAAFFCVQEIYLTEMTLPQALGWALGAIICAATALVVTLLHLSLVIDWLKNWYHIMRGETPTAWFD